MGALFAVGSGATIFGVLVVGGFSGGSGVVDVVVAGGGGGVVVVVCDGGTIGPIGMRCANESATNGPPTRAHSAATITGIRLINTVIGKVAGAFTRCAATARRRAAASPA